MFAKRNSNPSLPFRGPRRANREEGQTIIVAMIIMGLLLILGFVFIGIIDRNILTAGRMQTRSVANDLSYAGISYAHRQLLQSELGADWRGNPQSFPAAVDVSIDPDILYLRPGTGLRFKPGISQPDMGGPDGLGSFFRVNFNGGRALVRVRYSPSDINIFNPRPNGALRDPGQLRNYIIIESVGRPGRVDDNDPTTLARTAPIQFRNYATLAAYDSALAQMQSNERAFPQRAINRAFVSIGIIETARYVTNKYNVTRPVELGVSDMMGAIYDGYDVATGLGPSGNVPPLTMQLGTAMPLYTFSANPALTPAAFPGFGSMYINDDVVIHGQLTLNMNRNLGDKVVTSGNISAADANSALTINETSLNAGLWVTNQQLISGANLDSRSAAFSTANGLIIDGQSELDTNGYARGAGAKVPPSMLSRDPQTGETRYEILTKDSGALVNGANIGLYGYGQGVYVNNGSDRQMPEDESGRQQVGSQVSLVYDWLNPNNGQANSGWKGPFYTPPGSYVQLTTDGFVIIRDSDAATVDERTWKTVNGADTGASLNRFRVGRGSDRQLHIVNSFTPGVSINANLGAADYDKGPLFNGVVYFDGNIRVRGVIPTDIQLTMVSNATIYIEGSITKGILGSPWTATYDVSQGDPTPTPDGERLQRLSDSMLMLMAKDYVTLNTTQFVGPTAGQSLDVLGDTPNGPGFVPVKVATGGQLSLQTEFAPDNEPDRNIPSINPTNPSTWPPYPAVYYRFRNPSSKIPTNLLLAHTMADGPASATFVGMNVNFGAFDTTTPPESTYFFPVTFDNLISSVYTPQPPPASYPTFGLGGETYQRNGKFESSLFPLVDPTTVNVSDLRLMIANNLNGTYRLFSEGINDFRIQQTNYGAIPTNDYLVGKTALIPHDVRIEASMYAEEGSFFVIPGQWFNPNPNDSRDNYNAMSGSKATKDQKRLEDNGSVPGFPFYGESPDIRIRIIGSVSENMPPSIDVQSEWMRKWGWIPRLLGATNIEIPMQHVPDDPNYRGPANTWEWVPNLTISYDPVLATARRNGFSNDPMTNPLIRVDSYGRALPPVPRLPVSPALAYFGEVR